ncbi:MAG: hypothetical protein JW781_11135 [Deltaproteobacteria bacterium]|nr:hypothetical protein [Candidatus Anaeroferrophillacea bacterium]
MLRRLADKTGGAAEVVYPGEDVGPAIKRHARRIFSSSVNRTDISWPTQPQERIDPHAPGTFSGDTVIAFARFSEPPDNLNYLNRVLHTANLDGCLHGDTFSPPATSFPESRWLRTVERCHGGGEGSHGHDLGCMDTYMAGLARWTNEIGIDTAGSCDGHGGVLGRPLIGSSPRGCLRAVLGILSNGQWQLSDRDNYLTYRPPNPTLVSIYDRYWLLDAAEAIHTKRERLELFVADYIEISGAVMPAL